MEAARTGSVCGTTPQSPKGCNDGAGVPSGTVQWASVNSAHVMFTPPTEGRRAVGRLRAAALRSGLSPVYLQCRNSLLREQSCVRQGGTDAV